MIQSKLIQVQDTRTSPKYIYLATHFCDSSETLKAESQLLRRCGYSALGNLLLYLVYAEKPATTLEEGIRMNHARRLLEDQWFTIESGHILILSET